MVGALCKENEGTERRKVFVRNWFEEAERYMSERELLRRGPLTKTYCKHASQNATPERQVDAGSILGSDQCR